MSIRRYDHGALAGEPERGSAAHSRSGTGNQRDLS